MKYKNDMQGFQFYLGNNVNQFLFAVVNFWRGQ